MQLGMIGLGRMGGDMVRRLMRGGHACVVFDLDARTVKQCEQDGATGAALTHAAPRRVGHAAGWRSDG